MAERPASLVSKYFRRRQTGREAEPAARNRLTAIEPASHDFFVRQTRIAP